MVVLPSGEENKTLESVLTIVKAALEADFNRNSVFTGIGGGVITDMTAFASSIFKRGAKLELIPTSLLAMVDAACYSDAVISEYLVGLVDHLHFLFGIACLKE